MAAAVVATFLVFVSDLEATAGSASILHAYAYDFFHHPANRAYFLLVAAPALSLVMVSNVVYRSHKALKIRAIKPFKLLAVLVFLIALLAYQPETIGFAFCFLYALSGPFEWAMGWRKATQDDEIFENHDDDESMMEPGDGEHDDEAALAGADGRVSPVSAFKKNNHPTT